MFSLWKIYKIKSKFLTELGRLNSKLLATKCRLKFSTITLFGTFINVRK